MEFLLFRQLVAGTLAMVSLAIACGPLNGKPKALLILMAFDTLTIWGLLYPETLARFFFGS